jgi:hypothetical protein
LWRKHPIFFYSTSIVTGNDRDTKILIRQPPTKVRHFQRNFDANSIYNGNYICLESMHNFITNT